MLLLPSRISYKGKQLWHRRYRDRPVIHYVKNSESTSPNGPDHYNASQIALQSSWEIDFWGKLSNAKKSAYANYLATDAAHKAVQTRLVANIASVYYSLLALDANLEITKATVKNSAELVETMKVLKESGSRNRSCRGTK